MDKYLIIVAGGKGERLSDELPKQFAEVNGRPLLMHTFDAFTDIRLHRIILVLNRHYVRYWKELCEKYRFSVPHEVVEGGPKRFHSVKSGLTAVPDNVLVAIHDGVRPLVSADMIRTGFDIALRKGNAIPVIPVTDSIREISGPLSKSVDRNRFRLVQTPQFFQSTIIRKTYRKPYDEKFTDDASVLETAGQQIYLFEGDPANIKITTPEDLALAAGLLSSR
jgi:2-C-methyl-D-erythritol 4-phosphate cytidylyltransferase